MSKNKGKNVETTKFVIALDADKYYTGNIAGERIANSISGAKKYWTKKSANLSLKLLHSVSDNQYTNAVISAV